MKITIKKFKAIENLSFEIPAQIAGGNGIGKSTILEAISFCLTGKNLNGKEFEQVYDNRIDLHDAIADVSYFDNYGNEYRRIVSPIFQTSRAGFEEIKIKRNTICKKNDIAVNDFAPEFQDFYKFGTDYFFNQKEDVQRSIFIDALKSKMPVYDITANSLKLKELVKSQKLTVSEIESLRDLQKNTKDVEVPEISDELKKLNSEYLALSSTDNSKAISEINAKNNTAMEAFLQKKSDISDEIIKLKTEKGLKKSAIETKVYDLEKTQRTVFVKLEKKETELIEKQIRALKEELADLVFYPSIDVYAKANFAKNPVLVSNREKIEEITAREFTPSELESTSSACPLSGEICETARLYKDASAKLIFDNQKTSELEELKAENRTILEKEMYSANQAYQSISRQIDGLNIELARVSEFNLKVDGKNDSDKNAFDAEKNGKIKIIESELKDLRSESEKIDSGISIFEKQLSELVSPTPESLPEFAEISQFYRDSHEEYEEKNEIRIGAIAINENNAKNREKYEADIKEKQALLFDLDKTVNKIKNEISDYFSNLAGIVKSEFAGTIEIGVELLEFVMSRDEYKDCFRITANGKAFPFECNGALVNNVKLQVLSALQKLNGYNGVTVMDNCEANTTQKIETCGLNCVLATANLEKELSIKN